MARTGQNEEATRTDAAKDVAIEFSNSPQVFRWEESTPSQRSETRTSDEPALVRAIVQCKTSSPRPDWIANRFKVLNVLGSGGQAEVYLANDTTLDRQVAIKISKPDRPLSQEEQEQFKQEAKKIAGLKHPGIVTVHDFGIHNDGRCFIVLEYLPGQSLKECLRNPESRKTLTIERILDLVIRVAEALHFAHQQGVYHRDLKPGNILLDEHGNPRISDFGLAVTQETQRHLEGQIAGTVPYMSPEQVRGESHCLNGQTDIWALGVILYELFTGRRPFQGSSESELKKEILHRTPTPLRQWNDEVPQAVEDVVLRCLENDVGRRYPTAGDVGTALREMSANYKKQNAPHVPTAELSSKVLLERELAPPIPKTRLRTIMVFACLILLAVATGIIVFATIAPKDSDRRLQPEKWNNVLRWEPEELAAAGPQPVEPEWTYHPKARKVTFATNRRTLLSLANVDSPDFDYRVRLKQTPWNGNGNIGIFFGYNVNEVGGSHVAKYQAITIEWNGAASQIPLSIDRSLFFDPLTDGGPPGRRTYLHSMRLIPPSFNDKPPVLLISIRANRVVRIQLNDLQFPELASPRLEGIVLEQTSFAYAGIIGLYLSGAPEGSSGEFLSAEVFPRRSESAP